MQITPVPVPIVNTTTSPQAMAHALPAAMAQAVAPIGARAVDPSDRSGKKQKSRSNDDKARGGDSKEDTGKKGGTVNISV